MSWNFTPRIKFTPALWDRWLKQRQLDAQTLHLRRGIGEFRQMLSSREPRDPRMAGRAGP